MKANIQILPVLMDKMINNEPSPIKYASPVSQKILDEDKAITALPLGINKEKTFRELSAQLEVV